MRNFCMTIKNGCAMIRWKKGPEQMCVNEAIKASARTLILCAHLRALRAQINSDKIDKLTTFRKAYETKNRDIILV